MTTYLDSDLLTWQLDGACNSHTELFERVDLDGIDRAVGKAKKKLVSEARQVCMACPVRQKCFDQAMHEERYDNLAGRTGMRGGFTARERFQVAMKDRECARCHAPNMSNPQSLAHYHVTCSTCSAIINRELDERYFGMGVDSLLELV